MAAAFLLTMLALLGVGAGILMGQARTISRYLTGAGGGLLSGISLFWLVPEVAHGSGWTAAALMTFSAALILALLDRLFLHSNHSFDRIALSPILAATAIHSFLDGWSVRTLESIQIAGVTGPLGLALHKIPEGVAIGWIARQNLHSTAKAAGAATAVELMTLVGAWCEPRVSQAGFAAFGPWWTSGILALIGGSFLFLGIHAVLPNWRNAGSMAIFVTTFLLMGTIGLLRSGQI